MSIKSYPINWNKTQLKEIDQVEEIIKNEQSNHCWRIFDLKNFLNRKFSVITNVTCDSTQPIFTFFLNHMLHKESPCFILPDGTDLQVKIHNAFPYSKVQENEDWIKFIHLDERIGEMTIQQFVEWLGQCAARAQEKSTFTIQEYIYAGQTSDKLTIEQWAKILCDLKSKVK